MDDSTTVVLCVGVVRGSRFPKVAEHALIAECTFHKIAQSSPPVLANSFPTFNAEFRWEMTEKQIKEFRSKREPVKVQVYEVGGQNLTKNVLGSLVVYLRDVQARETREWMPLLHVKSSLRPELEISHRIVDKATLALGNAANANKNDSSKHTKKNNKKPKNPKSQQAVHTPSPDKAPQKPKEVSQKPPKPPASEYESDFEEDSESGSESRSNPRSRSRSKSRSRSRSRSGSDSGSGSDSPGSTPRGKTSSPAKNYSSPSRAPPRSRPLSPAHPAQPPAQAPAQPAQPPAQLPASRASDYFSDPELNDQSLDIAFHEYKDQLGVSQQQAHLRKKEALNLHGMVVGDRPPPSPPTSSTPTPKDKTSFHPQPLNNLPSTLPPSTSHLPPSTSPFPSSISPFPPSISPFPLSTPHFPPSNPPSGPSSDPTEFHNPHPPNRTGPNNFPGPNNPGPSNFGPNKGGSNFPGPNNGSFFPGPSDHDPWAQQLQQLQENVDVPRDSPEYAAALMLAKWREKQKEKFYADLKTKENQLLDKLRGNWQKREQNYQSVLAKKDRDISLLASRVEKALMRVEEKERAAIKTEEEIQLMKDNMQRMYESKMNEVQAVCQRLRDDHAARLEIEKVKMHELETGEKILRDRLAAIDRRLQIADDEFVECRRKEDNSPPQSKLQADVTNIKLQINEMHQQLSAAEKESKDNKENLIRIYKEIARVKREHTEEIQAQLQQEQKELRELRKQYHPIVSI